jgi:feruloyl esterase
VSAARMIYGCPVNPVTGESIFPGYEPGTESNFVNWPLWITGQTPGGGFQQFFGNGFYANFVFQNPAWDFRTFNFATDLAFADNGVGQVVNSINPDLRPFMNHGGKMIHYHGWADSAIAGESSINYYNQVKDVVSTNQGRGNYKEVQQFYRLFMVPGMAHCGGGDGPNAFGNGADAPVVDAEHDLLKALERWVEQGVAPDQIIATHYLNNNAASGVQFQRPLCPFPEVPRPIGNGDPNKASSFKCVKDLPQ